MGAYEDIIAQRDSPERLEKMKPVLDRIPDMWGKYLPEIGWDDLLLELDAKLSEIDPDYIIHQAKQKFGELRVYAVFSDGSFDRDSEFVELIREAAEKSTRTCEYCGKEGLTRRGGWIVVLCDEHADLK